MTIGVRTAGAWASGSTSISTNLPTSVAAGDMMVLFVGCKPYNATIADISGWTRLGTQQANGTTGSGIDTGSVAWTVFYRQFVNGDTAPTVTVTTGNVALACIFGFTKTESAWATPAAYFGSDTTSGTDYSVTAASSTGLNAGDYLCAGTVISGNDATLGTPTCSATGVTIGTVTQAPASNGSTNTGQDLAAAGFYAPVDSGGLSTANAVLGWTLSAGQTGGSALVRVRETNDPVAPTAGTVQITGQTPTVGFTHSNAPTAGAVRLVGQTPEVTVDTGGVDVVITVPSGAAASPLSRVTPRGWLHETTEVSRVTPFGWVQETRAAGNEAALRFVGQAPTVTVTAQTVITPDAGTVRTVGQQPTVGYTHSVAPTVGTVRTVGQTPLVGFTHSVAPTAGTVQIAGQTPTVALTQSVAPTAGTVQLVGQQPLVGFTHSVSPTTGAVVFSGQAPLVGFTHSVVPTAGTVQLVGQQPTVTADGSVTVTPTVGALVFSGQAPTISVSGTASAFSRVTPAGWLHETGTLSRVTPFGWVQESTTAAVSESKTVSPSVGTFRLVGQAPTLSVTGPITVAPTVGAVRVVGQTPTVMLSTSVLVSFATPTYPPERGADLQSFSVLVRKTGTSNPTVSIALYEAGSLVTQIITAQTVTSATGEVISATWDAADLADPTGADVECYIIGYPNGDSYVEVGAVSWEVDYATAAEPTAGVVRVVGQQPTVGFTHSVSPSHGVVRVDGQQPTVSTTQSVAPTAGAVQIVGQSPTVSFTDLLTASPQSGTIRITGQAPTLAQTWSAQPQAGEVRLIGQQPTLSESGTFTVTPQSGVIRFVGNAPTIPAKAEDQPSGGWADYFHYEQERERRKAKRLQAELEEEREREALAERLERVLVEDGTLDRGEADALRLEALVAQYATADLPNRAQRAIRYAERAQSDLSVQLALREIQRVAEEEELAVLMALALD